MDTAGLLGAEALILDSCLRQFELLTGHQFVVLTVPTTRPAPSIDSYAHAVFQSWHLGRKGIDDGLLLVVASADRTLRIEVGTGLEASLTNERAGHIVNQIMVPRFKDGNYVSGIYEGVVAVMQTVSPQLAAPAALHTERGDGEVIAWCIGAVVGLFFFGMSLFFGILGLAATALITGVIPIVIYGDWRGYTCAAVMPLIWLCLRWWMIEANVRKYHLPGSRHPALTWIGAMLFAIGLGMAGPAIPITRVRLSSGWSLGGGRSSSRSSASSDSDSGGSGGSSSGGGASGSW